MNYVVNRPLVHLLRLICLQEELKQLNLASTILGSNDVKTGMKSAIKALGTNNPFTINTAGEVSSTVAVQGGKMSAFKF